MLAAKHKIQIFVFNAASQKLADFLDELQKLAKALFGVAAQAITEQLIYAKKASTSEYFIKSGPLGERHV